MARRADQGEFFWGYSIGSNGRIIVTLLENPRYIGTDKLYDILLDNGEHIFCTPDHEFILRNGLITQADDLRPGMSLMPLYRDVFRGYEGVYQPLNGTYTPTHRLADEWSIRHGLYENVPDTHRHHIDHNRRNNNPPNIQRVPAAEHIRYHNSDYYDGPDFNAEEHAQAISEGLLRHRNDPEWLARFLEAQRNRAQAFWRRPEYAREREKVCAQHRLYWSDSVNRQAQRERQIARWNDSALRVARSQMSKEIWSRDDGTRREQQREIMRSISIRREITEERVLRALHEAGSIRGAARLLGCDRTVFRRFPEILSKFRGTAQRNHKVVSMTSISGEHDVYCLTVPEAGNFALEAGVFVSNCGIIINTTPFEPGWEGYVTLEISNTTPLPARIYANEGIGQVLFFESDEQCEVSYADKQGKYQGQQDITLPKL
jgi:dCTP deaminase